MAENIASQVNSLANGVMLEGGNANIQAYYGPYTSLDNAVTFFQNNVESYLLYVPAGYKVGIGTQEIVGGLPTWTSITQEYIYIGGGISKAHFVPVIMNLDTDYIALKNAVGDTVDEVSLDQNYTSKVNIDYTLTKGGGGSLEIGAATDTTAGIMTKDDRLLLNQLIPVLESGGWNIDENYQVGGTVGGGSSQNTIPEGLETRLTRIENILGDLYDNDDPTGASDGQITIEDDGVSNN